MARPKNAVERKSRGEIWTIHARHFREGEKGISSAHFIMVVWITPSKSPGPAGIAVIASISSMRDSRPSLNFSLETPLNIMI